jgi:hypothetical protein
MADHRRVLRIPADPGRLNNQRIALEVGVGLAALSGRALSIPGEPDLQGRPLPGLDNGTTQRAACLLDLFDVPVEVVTDEGYAALCIRDRPVHPSWPSLILDAAFVLHDNPIGDGLLGAFLAGRKAVISFSPSIAAAPIVEVNSRLLAFPSFVFCLNGGERAMAFDAVSAVLPKSEFQAFAQRLVAELAPFNAVHVRRTDFVVAMAGHDRISADEVADNLSGLLPATERLVVCTDEPATSPFFTGMRDRFSDLVFLNEFVLETPSLRADFASLPFHDEAVLGLVSQLTATNATVFIGSGSSTFTGVIHRDRCRSDPNARFLFVADCLGMGSQFQAGEYREAGPGPFTWNRVRLAIPPANNGWFRSWPECASATLVCS